MCLHITALSIHTFFIAMLQIVTVYTFMNPAPENYKIMIVSRIVLFTTQSISQVVVIYLFVSFSKPVVVKKEEGDSDSD